MVEEKVFVKDINSCFGNREFAQYVENEDTLMLQKNHSKQN